jgi:hypothetical protein
MIIYALDTNTISNLLRGEGNIEKNFENERCRYNNRGLLLSERLHIGNKKYK